MKNHLCTSFPLEKLLCVNALLCEKFSVLHSNTVRMSNTTFGLTQVAPIGTSVSAHQRTSETAYQRINVVTCLWHPLAFFTFLCQAEEERRAAAGEELQNVFLPLTSCLHSFMRAFAFYDGCLYGSICPHIYIYTHYIHTRL